jgi:hypothetical protein
MIKNLEYLMISLSTGCVSDCKWCTISSQKNTLYDYKEVVKNIKRCFDIGFIWEFIVFFNYEYFLLSSDILNTLIQHSQKRNVYFHTRLESIHLEQIRYLKENSVSLVFQRNLNMESFSLFLKNFHLFTGMHFECVFWCDESVTLIKKITIKQLRKLWFREVNRDHFIFWKIHLKFFYYKWGRIQNKHCFFDGWLKLIEDNIIEVNNKVYTPSYFEISLNGDIRVHEPPCWYWNIVISNIFREKKNITNDFYLFNHYIDNFLDSNVQKDQHQICTLCNKKEYHYK